MSKILFLTTHNLATNPRLVKEIKLALQHNYEVEVICYIFRNWSYEMNHKMLQEFQNQGVKFHCIEAGRKNMVQWLIAVLKEKSARLLSKILPLKNAALANAVSRRNVGLLAAVTKITLADWVIGHNPGALWATCYAGKRLKCKMGFDVEDYHPGEGNDMHLQEVTKKLMQQVLPKMDYVSFAAQLIRKEVSKDLGGEGKNWVTVLNYFPGAEFVTPKLLEGPLKLVWFSQNIGAGRGLEYILPSIKELAGKVELHLFGNMHAAFYDTILKENSNIYLHQPLPHAALHLELSNFDIGLALEPAKDRNNDLAISNKFLAYLQAGLYVLSSNTLSQIDHLKNFSSSGVCINIKQNAEIETTLKKLIKEQNIIRDGKSNRFQDSSKSNWEHESLRIMNQWHKH